MISVEEALDKILSSIEVLGTEERTILNSLGYVLAEDIVSNFNIPPLDNSAMDGYAVRSEDIKGANTASPRILKVIGTVYAGMVSRQEVVEGTAIRIMTGAPLPQGADCVVRFEDTDEQSREKNPGVIGVLKEVPAGTNVRRAGEDVPEGSLVIKKGTVLKSAHIGVIASLGYGKVSVIRKPHVAILATGNELVEIGNPLPPGKIYNSNTYSIAALVSKYGGIPHVLGIAPDDEELLIRSIRRGLNTDMLITTGGVSLGDYDMVKDVLANMGKIDFWTVRMKPGKPMAFGLLNDGNRKVPHMGLPGNPVSAMISFEILARPAILKMMGIKKFDKPVIEAIMESTVKNDDGRRVFTRAIVERRNGTYYAKTTGPQGSNILTSMSLANGLVVVPEDVEIVRPGEKVRVIMLDWSGEEF